MHAAWRGGGGGLVWGADRRAIDLPHHITPAPFTEPADWCVDNWAVAGVSMLLRSPAPDVSHCIVFYFNTIYNKGHLDVYSCQYSASLREREMLTPARWTTSPSWLINLSGPSLPTPCRVSRRGSCSIPHGDLEAVGWCCCAHKLERALMTRCKDSQSDSADCEMKDNPLPRTGKMKVDVSVLRAPETWNINTKCLLGRSPWWCNDLLI